MNSSAPGQPVARIAAAAASRSYGRPPQLDVAAEQRPVGARLRLVRHADAAGVDHARRAHARGRTACACGRRRRSRASTPARIGRDDLASGVVSRKISVSLVGVAWQKSTVPRPSTSTVDGRRQSREHGHVTLLSRESDQPSRVRVRLRARPRRAGPRPPRVRRCRESPAPARRARARGRAHSRGSGPVDVVAADHDELDALPLHLGEDGLERGQVAVDVGERCYPHAGRLEVGSGALDPLRAPLGRLERRGPVAGLARDLAVPHVEHEHGVELRRRPRSVSVASATHRSPSQRTLRGSTLGSDGKRE